MLALAACCAPSAPADRASGPDAARPPARVVLESPSGRVSTVAVEVMRAEAEQARGLMFREKLGPDEGMLFVFPESAEHAFWMKNTLLALDMIFIDERREVVGIVERAVPLSTEPRSVGRPSRFVLEVNAGFAAARGVKVGDRVRLEGDAAR
ncbi:MAG TPA: DUF192 domain-containing protein [Anaeromyxobacteraceae bacterium]|nr:DUF192 domain-containing protein [Anaeromyxobacteraceae bacterium]